VNDADTDVVARLRALANWLETRPTIANQSKYLFHTAYVFTDADCWQDCLAELGTFTKGTDDKYLEATVVLPGGSRVCLNVAKEATCQRVEAGVREVEREVYPADVQPEIVTETELVYEWVCPDSWLNPTEVSA